MNGSVLPYHESERVEVAEDSLKIAFRIGPVCQVVSGVLGEKHSAQADWVGCNPEVDLPRWALPAGPGGALDLGTGTRSPGTRLRLGWGSRRSRTRCGTGKGFLGRGEGRLRLQPSGRTLCIRCTGSLNRKKNASLSYLCRRLYSGHISPLEGGGISQIENR